MNIPLEEDEVARRLRDTGQSRLRWSLRGHRDFVLVCSLAQLDGRLGETASLISQGTHFGLEMAK